jgi:hypothetical protein
VFAIQEVYQYYTSNTQSTSRNFQTLKAKILFSTITQLTYTKTAENVVENEQKSWILDDKFTRRKRKARFYLHCDIDPLSLRCHTTQITVFSLAAVRNLHI